MSELDNEQIPAELPTVKPEAPEERAPLSLEEQMRLLEDAERAIGEAYTTGKAERSKITEAAQQSAQVAVELAGEAIEADELADDAMRMTYIAEKGRDRERTKVARARERAARKEAKRQHRAATKAAKQAYEAIKFSDPTKMGFMRFVQVMFAIHITGVIIFLMLTSRDSMSYDVTTIMDWVMVVLEGIAFWMFMNRYKVARPFLMGMAGLGIAVQAAVDVMSGNFSFIGLIINGAWYFFLLLYFAFSKRVKATLVNDFSQHQGLLERDDFVIERSGWPFVRNLIMYFIVFSILGHWMEMGMCQFIIMGLVEGEYDPTNTMLWRDWLYPFPMEGAAVVIIALFLYPMLTSMKERFKNPVLPYVLSFVANALMCSLIEFSMGLLVNADHQLWDYSDHFGNIMGQVCLQNTIAFGVAASIIAWFVYPALERWLARFPRDRMNIAFVAVALFGAIVWSLYLVTPPGELDVNGAETEEGQALSERDEIELGLGFTDATSEALYETIENAESLTDEEKAELLEHLQTIDAELNAVAEELGFDLETDEAA